MYTPVFDMIFDIVSPSPEAALSHHCYGVATVMIEKDEVYRDVLGTTLVVDMVHREGSCITFKAYEIHSNNDDIEDRNDRLDEILLCTGETDVDKLMTYARVCNSYNTLIVTSFELKDSALYPSEMSFIQPRRMVERYSENRGVIRIEP